MSTNTNIFIRIITILKYMWLFFVVVVVDGFYALGTQQEPLAAPREMNPLCGCVCVWVCARARNGCDTEFCNHRILNFIECELCVVRMVCIWYHFHWYYTQHTYTHIRALYTTYMAMYIIFMGANERSRAKLLAYSHKSTLALRVHRNVCVCVWLLMEFGKAESIHTGRPLLNRLHIEYCRRRLIIMCVWRYIRYAFSIIFVYTYVYCRGTL